MTIPPDTIEAVKLLACPFCGNCNVTIGYDGQPAINIYAVCVLCGAQGPKHPFSSGMMFDFLSWNTRDPAPVDAAPDVESLRAVVLFLYAGYGYDDAGAQSIPEWIYAIVDDCRARSGEGA